MSETSASLLAFPSRNQDRLRLALRHLEAALTAQAEAVASLRSELRGLHGAMHGLQTSLGGYRGELAAASRAVQRANREARRLEGTAEEWLAATRA